MSRVLILLILLSRNNMNSKSKVYTTLFIFLLLTSISLFGQDLMNAKEPNDNRVLQEKILFSAKPVSGNYYSIFMMNPDGTELTQLFNDNYHRRAPILSNDQTRIYYNRNKYCTEQEGDSVWICSSDPDGSNEQVIWTHTEISYGVRVTFDISPDNLKLIYATYYSPILDGDVFEFNLVSLETKNLTNDLDYLEDEPMYSQNGSLITYSKNGGPSGLSSWPMYRMNSDGSGNAIFKPSGDGHYHRPEYSPDGALLVYCFKPFIDPYDLYIASSDGSSPQQIIPSSGSPNGIHDPTFSPDGKKLAFSRNYGTELLITDLQGNIIIQLSPNGIDGFYDLKWYLMEFEPLPDPAGPISGPAEVCEGSTGIVYSIDPVNYATGYVWTVTPGVIITQGANTSEITVTFGPDAMSGSISVYGTNDAGNGLPSPEFFITVHPSPADIGEQTNITDVNISNGLIAYYPFNGNADDYSGNGNHGIIHGAILSEDRCGINNNSMYFNGVDNWIEVPNSPSLQSTEQALSVSSWIKAESAAIYFICKVNGPSYNAYQFRTGINLLTKQYFLGLNGADYCWEDTILVDLSLNEWFLFTITYDKNNVKFYFDGELSNIHPLTELIIPNSERLEIGRDAHGPIEWMMGCLDDLRLYNRALTDDEIAVLYQQSCYPAYLEGSLAPNSVCRGESASLEIINAQAGVSYQLLKDGVDYGAALVGDLDTLSFSLDNLQQTGSFTVEATDTASGCSIVLDTTFTVSVLSPNVAATAVPDDEYAPATVSLGSTSTGASSFEWFLDGNSIATTEQAGMEIGEPGTYTFILVASSGPPAYCTVSDTVRITVKMSYNVVLEIPNSFTPNGDGINDYFEIQTEGITNSDVWIKDRWGITVNEFDGQSGRWDGIMKSGNEAPAGPYYFHVEAIDYRGNALEESGIVYLIRELIELTPNPAKERIQIRMNGRLAGERTLRICSIDGICIIEQKFNNEIYETDISALKHGMYIVEISNGSDQQFLRLIKD